MSYHGENGVESGWASQFGAELTRMPALADVTPNAIVATAIDAVEPMRSFMRRESKRGSFPGGGACRFATIVGAFALRLEGPGVG